MDDYKKLKAICDEIDVLIAKNIPASSPQFKAWKIKTDRFLIGKYGDSSYEFDSFNKIRFSRKFYTMSTPEYVFVKDCQDGLLSAKAILGNYLEEIKDENSKKNTDSQSKTSQLQINEYSKVFIVHGHNGELREAVARLVEKQGIQAIILNEQVNRGKTIIEKIEKYGNVEAAICLFTADDIGKAKSEPNDKKRARQNVLFEAGYFIGKLGRDNVVIVSEKGIEIPSDMEGIVYTDTNSWKFNILQELNAIGYNIDLNKLMN